MVETLRTLPAAAAGAAAVAAAGRLAAGGARPAAHGDRGEQSDGVVVALRARAGRGRLAHRAGSLEGVAAGAAAVLVTGHVVIVAQPADGERRPAELLSYGQGTRTITLVRWNPLGTALV